MASVNYAVTDNWGSGFVANMTVAGGNQALHGWTVEFDAAFGITNIWGAVILSHVGNHYVVGNLSWNADIAAGANTTFGFQATPGGGGAAATGLTINGSGAGTPPPVVPTLSIADASIAEGDAGSSELSFTVSLSQAAAGPVTVTYATGDGTATAGSDYSAGSGIVTFSAGETSKVVKVAIAGDTTVEADETLHVTLSGASGATIARAAATGTIVNDDLALPAPSAAGVSVAYSVTSNWGSGFNGDMKVGGGSAPLDGWTVEFTASFDITNIWNAVIVSHVGHHYVVKNASYNGQVAAGQQVSFGFQAKPGSDGTQALGFTVNGTAAGQNPGPTLSVADATVSEGNAGTRDLVFTVALSSAATGPVTVVYKTANGTAAAGSDYVAQTGTLSFAAGETSKVVRVPVLGDEAVEASETLNLILSSPSGATIARGTATGTITNDDAAPPTLRIGDATFAEGSAATPGHGTFMVTLSRTSDSPVTVKFATADGTAKMGGDYVAKSGTLTFAPGETRKTITVAAVGDAAIESDERFSVLLSDAVDAAIADGKGIGTITNDDLPTLRIADTSVVEGDPGSGGSASGWLSTSGNQIVDSAGQSVQIAGVNWFGFESSNLAPHGLWTRGYRDMMKQMVDLGFNTIRLPFSSDMLHTAAAPNGIDFSRNPDLQGLSALQVMDRIVDYAGEIGLKIILDHHRSDPGAGVSPNGLWYDAQHSQADWVSDWAMLATRYADDPQVIGADLHNEPYNGTWGGGGPNDWAAAAEQAGNAIGRVNPNWLIFVEGIGTYQGQSYWWGGNLMGVKDRPIQLDIANKLVYSAHDYPNSVYPQPWFQGPDFPANLPAKFDQMWGYIYKENIAPVYIGEFGTRLDDPKDAPWLAAITSYLGGDLDNDGTHDLAAGKKGVGWTFWSWNPNSGDTGGILKDDWTGVNEDKLAYLKPIEFDFDSTGGGSAAHADFLLTLSAPATGPVTVQFHTVPGDATGADFTGTSGSVTFAAGEQSKTISIPVTADLIGEADEHFTVVLSNASGATISRAIATATIVDDDGAAATVAALAGGSHTREFSPYIDMAMAQDADLAAISHVSGIENFTLAFMLGSDRGIGWQGTGAITDDTLANGTTILQQVETIQAQGGHITISFGGAAGQEAALTAPDAATLQAEYQSVIDRYHVDSIDFDIEGAALADRHSIVLRDQALAGLQAANPDLRVSFTLPVLPTGLDANGLDVLCSARHDGVKVDVVNIMAMDYGASVDNDSRMGLNAIQAAIATEGQLQDLGLDAKIGITPMIGVSDVASEVFTLADAQALVNFAESDPNIVRLSMWSVARDSGATTGAHYASPDSSGVAQTPYEYAGILQHFGVTS